uniref:Uncharacterized protein n=1 Tax=Hyaloperonospora arabidopsidis (strain Emoy2) TaxID=559515 RepID=M4B6B9_HYAAE
MLARLLRPSDAGVRDQYSPPWEGTYLTNLARHLAADLLHRIHNEEKQRPRYSEPATDIDSVIDVACKRGQKRVTCHAIIVGLWRDCNREPVACTVTVQATYTGQRVRWCLETSRTRVVQSKVSTREKGKSRTVFSIVNLLSINPI